MEEPAPRMFWPREVWGKYASTLADFKEEENSTKAVYCLNHMVSSKIEMVFCIYSSKIAIIVNTT